MGFDWQQTWFLIHTYLMTIEENLMTMKIIDL